MLVGPDTNWMCTITVVRGPGLRGVGGTDIKTRGIEYLNSVQFSIRPPATLLPCCRYWGRGYCKLDFRGRQEVFQNYVDFVHQIIRYRNESCLRWIMFFGKRTPLRFLRFSKINNFENIDCFDTILPQLSRQCRPLKVNAKKPYTRRFCLNLIKIKHFWISKSLYFCILFQNHYSIFLLTYIKELKSSDILSGNSIHWKTTISDHSLIFTV